MIIPINCVVVTFSSNRSIPVPTKATAETPFHRNEAVNELFFSIDKKTRLDRIVKDEIITTEQYCVADKDNRLEIFSFL